MKPHAFGSYFVLERGSNGVAACSAQAGLSPKSSGLEMRVDSNSACGDGGIGEEYLR